jgi:hypothetical protein
MIHPFVPDREGNRAAGHIPLRGTGPAATAKAPFDRLRANGGHSNAHKGLGYRNLTKVDVAHEDVRHAQGLGGQMWTSAAH